MPSPICVSGSRIIRSRAFVVLLALASALILLTPPSRAQVLYNGQRSTVVSGPMDILPVGNTFLEPSGLVVDHNGILWINDMGTNQLMKFAPSGSGFTLVTNSNGYPVGYPTDGSPHGECGNFTWEIGVDSANGLFYTETALVANEDGLICAIAGTSTDLGGLGTDPVSPRGITVDQWNNAYVADPSSGNIWEFPAPAGHTVDGPVVCSYPYYTCSPVKVADDFAVVSNIGAQTVAVDRFGNVYFTNQSTLYVAWNQGGGNYNVVEIASGFNFPEAVAVDARGDVYVADTFNNRIVREVPIPNGFAQSVFGGFNHPSGITVDDSGNLFVSDTDNFQVIKYALSAPSFGSQNVGSSSGAMGVSFTILPNTVASIAIVTNGATGSDFADAGSSTCTAKTYTATTTCSVSVKFTPSAPGPRGGAVIFYDGSGNPIETLRITGQGVGPEPVFETPSAQLLTPNADYYYTWGATAIDPAGNAYIPVPFNNDVMVIAPGGASSTLSLSSPVTDPSYPTANSTLNNPSAIVMDSIGTLYIADTGNNRILVRQPTGTPGSYYLYNLPTTGFTLNGPQGLTTDAAGDIFIADTGNNRILEVTSAGVAKQIGLIASPTSVAVDASGNVYAPSYVNNEVWKLAAGTWTASAVSTSPVGTENPVGIAVDAAGTLYIADSKLGLIEVPAGGNARSMNLPWPLNGYVGPNAVSLDSAGNLYLSASGVGVYKILRNGIALNFATTKTGLTSTDSPQTVLAENAGNLPLGISAVSYPTDFPQSSGDSSACSGSTSLNPGATCDLPISFLPTIGSTLSEQVTLTDNAGNVAGSTQSVSVNGTGTVGGQSQTISSPLPGGVFTRSASYPYSTSGPLIYISASSGLPVTLTVLSGPGNFSGSNTTTTTSGNVVNLSGVGTIVIQATQPGNATYAPAPPVQFSIGVTPATIFAYPFRSSFTQIYGAPAPTVSYTLSGLVYTTDQVYLAVTGGATPASPVGNDTITLGLTGPMAPSYQLSSTTTTGTLVVSPAPLTVAGSDAYMMAGSSVPTLGYSLVGLLAGDTPATAVTGTPQMSTPATSSSAAGSYPVDLSLGTLASANYTLTAANGVLNVFSPISMGSVPVGSTGSAAVNFETGPASTFASVFGSTNAIGVDAFHASEPSCSGGACSGTVDFAPTIPGPWTGNYNLFDNSSPGKLLISIPVTGTGTGPQAVFTPGAVSTVGSGLQFPTGVAVDSNGDLYIADLDNNRVVEIPSGGGSQISIGTGLNSPIGVAVDSLLNVYITDTGNHRVVEVPAGGSQTVLATGFSYAAGIAVDRGGNVYVADSNASAVYLIPSGGGTPVPVGSGWGAPFAVAVDGSGSVFVADANLNNVTKLPAGGGPPVTLPFSGLNDPSGVAVDPVGNVFVTDTIHHRVLELSSVTGQQISLLTGLSYPHIPAIDRFGILYIPDSSNNRVLALNPNSPPALSFASTAAGSTSSDSPQTVTVQNIGNQPLQFSALTYPTDFPEAAGVATDCTSSTSLASAGFCTLSIDFSPLLSSFKGAGTPMSLSETIGLTDNNLNGTNVGQSVGVSGSATYAQPSITSPTSGTVLGGATVFTWNPGSGASKFQLYIGTTSVGSHNLYQGPDLAGTVTSSASINIPANGVTLYVRLWYMLSNSWYSQDYTWTESSIPAITSPSSGTLLGGPTTFTWNPGAGISAYQVYAGTTGTGSSNLYRGPDLSGTATSSAAVNIPGNGATVYVRLWYEKGTAWFPLDYTYTEATAPSITSPSSGTLLGGLTKFTWNPGTGVSEFQLYIGTTGAGSSNIYRGPDLSGSTTTSPSITIPANGGTLYVRLWYVRANSWFSQDYTYTAATPPSMSTPAPGSTIGSPTTFTWNPGSGASGYQLYIGTTGAGSHDVYQGPDLPGTSTSSSSVSIPANRATLNVRLWYLQNGSWQSIDSTYTEP